MTMDNYWAERFERLKALEMKRADDCSEMLKEIYGDALRQCQKEVAGWYARFASVNGISLADARRILDAKELKAFKMDLKTYRELALTEEFDKTVIQTLENASIRQRLTRAQELWIRTAFYAEKAGKQLDVKIADMLKETYEDTHYKAAYETYKAKGRFEPFARLPTDKVEQAVKERWAADGRDFSERIWQNRKELAGTIKRELTQSMMLQEGVDGMSERLAKRFNVAYSNARRLVETETAHVTEKAILESYQRTGVDEYEILATLDNRTSEICRELDGKRYNVKDAVPGVTMPPFHPWCRSTTVPYIPEVTEVADEGGTRAARSDRKTEFVESKLTYDQWAEKYLGKPPKKKKPKEEPPLLKDPKERIKAIALSIGFNYVADEVLTKLTHDIVEPCVGQLKRLDAKFGAIKAASNMELDTERQKNVIASVRMYIVNPLDQALNLNRGYYDKAKEAFVKETKEAVKSFWSMPCKAENALFYNVTHEYGHILENMIVAEEMKAQGWTAEAPRAFIDMNKKTVKARYKWYYKINDETKKKIVDEIIAIAERMNKDFDILKHLSRYGRTNNAEFFAEVFANSQLGEPNELGKAMNEWLNQKGLIKDGD